MTIEEFQQFIDDQHELFSRVKDTNQTERERTFARMIKLTEEVGELANEVLANYGDQRKDKLATQNRESLEQEVADVMITTFLLAKSLDIDPMVVVGPKIEKIRAKHNKQL